MLSKKNVNSKVETTEGQTVANSHWFSSALKNYCSSLKNLREFLILLKLFSGYSKHDILFHEILSKVKGFLFYELLVVIHERKKLLLFFKFLELQGVS